MRRYVLLVVLLLVATLAIAGMSLRTSAAGPRAYALGAVGADTYEALGCAHIVGWDWLRATDARVKWVFDTSDLAGATPNKVFLNFDGLVTNGVDGGAGYDARLKFYVRVPDGADGPSNVQAVNPFRPQDPNNSEGVGYAVYGHGGALSASLVRQAVEAGSLEVMLTWGRDTVSPLPRHVAVKKDALTIGYVK